MWSLNYSSTAEITKVLSDHSLAMTKKFGQNFLISPEARERIVSLIKPSEGMKVWEIGPGLGAITHLLLKAGCSVTAFEIDHGFASILRNEAFTDEDFTLIEGDALETLFTGPLTADRVVGNLPYNVGSQVIARLIENGYLPSLMVFTLQKEVADRMSAEPGSEAYSSFSILTQLDYTNTTAFMIRPGSFYPAPNVDSAVVVMKKRDRSLVDGEERKVFLALVRALFAQRRKTIRNNLLSSPVFSSMGKDRIEAAFSSVCLTGSERAEALSFDSLVALMRALKEPLS